MNASLGVKVRENPRYTEMVVAGVEIEKWKIWDEGGGAGGICKSRVSTDDGNVALEPAWDRKHNLEVIRIAVNAGGIQKGAIQRKNT